MAKFDELIKELRKEKGLTQAELAVIFNVTKQTVSAWENGLQETDFETLEKLAKYFEVSVDYLLGLS